MKKKVTIDVCSECGCEDILYDAWASFNPVTGQNELADTFDHTHCPECDGECGTVEKEIEVEIPDESKPWVCEHCKEEVPQLEVRNYCPNCGEQIY